MSEEMPNRKNHPHIEVNKLDEKKKKSMLNRIVVAIVLLVLAIPCIALGGWFWFVFITFFLGFACYEIMKASQKKYRWYIWVFTYFLVFVYVYWFLLKFNAQQYMQYLVDRKTDMNASFHFELEQYFSYLDISIYSLAASFGIYSLCAVLHEDFDWHDVIYFFAMTFMVGLGFQAFMFLRYYPLALDWGPGYDVSSNVFRYWGSTTFLIYVVAATFLNDIFAYFVGVLFGKHHINPRISPNKTWEGFIGGIVLSAGASFGIAALLEGCGYPILPHLSIFANSQAWWQLLLMSIALPLIGNLGDFTFSMIKRFYGFKDYSHLLGAHGGVLDRVDSLLFSSVAASVFVVFSGIGWNIFR